MWCKKWDLESDPGKNNKVRYSKSNQIIQVKQVPIQPHPDLNPVKN
jgi:hypothetical protein